MKKNLQRWFWNNLWAPKAWMSSRACVFLTWQSCDTLANVKNRKKIENQKFQKIDQKFSSSGDLSATRSRHPEHLGSCRGMIWVGLDELYHKKILRGQTNWQIFRISIFSTKKLCLGPKFFDVELARRCTRITLWAYAGRQEKLYESLLGWHYF